MVLCSILIHGLSIPFFSLGRRVHSVSRTWSRHAAPDWTTHIRRVSRGEDIVINRDSDMERGESTIEKESGAPTPGETLSEGTQRGEEWGVSEIEEHHQHQHQRDMKEENPPDGTEVVAEWKEGPHRIIERRSEPGEEASLPVVILLCRR
jgi:hypothetical protein